jgi:hypothetical protein
LLRENLRNFVSEDIFAIVKIIAKFEDL